MPDAANLLYSLGMVADEQAIPIWRRVIDLLGTVPAESIRDRSSGVYYYVDAVCFGMERLGHPDCIPLLTRLHSYPFVHGLVASEGPQVDFFPERQAYLELVIGRALARCGSPHGFITLIDYLNDSRSLLAEHAHSELVSVTGKDFGKDHGAWLDWLEVAGDQVQPAPWRAPTEAMQAWTEEILVGTEGGSD
jgi:hypothetical protein